MLSALLLALAVLPAAAQEGDPAVTLGGTPAAGVYTLVRPSGAGTALLELGPSDPFPAPYDSVIFQGEAPAAGVGFEAARQEPAGWSAWRKADLHRGADGRFWAKVRFDGAGTGALMVRALGSGPAASSPLTLYSMQVFMSGAQEASRPGPRPAAAPAEPPAFIARDGWGARPPKEPFSPHKPDRVTQHHTQGRRPSTLEESLAEMRFLQDFHQNGRGWNDIGYHFLVDSQGRIFQGRPVDVVGAHVKNDNSGNVGICFMGSHHPPFNHPVAPEQLDASVRLGRWLQASYGAGPETYKGHRDRGQTDCPGDVLYPLLEKVRAAWRGPGLAERLQSWLGNLRP
ncbi:MAG: N-acetylmuramoyl-L-alanine amidase [Elusimicrobia bacterium]|nr:N-acetylmuramoyl-L-alanine amidase [Elusimicrobiota bacterium]